MVRTAKVTRWRLGLLLAGLALVALGCQFAQGPRPEVTVQVTPGVTATRPAQPIVEATPSPTELPPAPASPTPTVTPTVPPEQGFEPRLWLPLVFKAYGVAEAEASVLTALSATPAPTRTVTPPAALTVPILMYHYVSELPQDADTIRRDLTVTPERFEAQLAYLQEQGYTSLTLFELYAALQGERELPAKPIVLTFDDGYEGAYTVAFPLLQKYGFTGTFFVIAYVVEGGVPGYLSWEQARAMADAGMSIQSHSLDHVDLRERSAEYLQQQLGLSRALIEARVGQPVRFFCYPAGRYDAAVIRALDQAGYWGAVTTQWGSRITLAEHFTWPRLRVRGDWDLEAFKQILP